MDSKKINQLGTEVDPQQSDLTVIGDPISGQLKKITWLQVAHLIGAQASVTLQQVTDNGNTTTDPITTGGLTLTNLGTGLPRLTSGEFVGTYGYGLANGVATLDSGGKIPASQLPSSVMEYKGVWNASTNTPTLADGTGDNGDVYLVNVAGSQNLGSGTISFAIGDWVVYNGTIWQKSLNSNAVASVFGRTGTIVAQEGDYNIDQLGDVAITTPATNDYLRYNGSSWVNTQFPTFVSSDKLVLQVRNNSGATINKGTVVYINGAAAGYPTIAKAQANADNTSAQTLGLVQDNIANNSNGVVVIVGQITGIDTSAYTAGTQLYLSGTTAGAFTSTKTLAPTHLVYVGIVTTQNAVNGVIEVKIQNGYELDEIHDVAISSVADKNVLAYESSTSLWKNKSLSSILVAGDIPAGSNNYIQNNATATAQNAKFYIGTGNRIDNSTNTDGIYLANSGIGNGYRVANSSTGNGIVIDNSSGGTGLLVGNTSTGSGIVVDNSTAATGYLFRGAKNAVNKILMSDSGNITADSYNGATATFTGDLTSNQCIVNGAAGTYRQLTFRTSGLNRWVFYATNSAESGSNAGSDLAIVKVLDNGTTADVAFGMNRATGDAKFYYNLEVLGNVNLSPNNTVGGTNYYIGQVMATSDSWKIYGNSVATNQGELVFELQDDAVPIASNGQRFRFYFGNNSTGTAKSALIIDYDLSTFDTPLKATINSLSTAATTFLVSDSGTIKSRTAAQVLSDIGGQTALTNPVTGTGSAGQVSYFSGTSAISGNNNLFIDTTNWRLGIGMNNPSKKLGITSTTNQDGIEFIMGTEARASYLITYGSNPSAGRDFGLLAWRNLTLQGGNGTTEGLVIINAKEDITFNTGSSYTNRITVLGTNGQTTIKSSSDTVALFNSTYGQSAIAIQNNGTSFAYFGSGISVCSTAAADDVGIGTAGLAKNIVFATGTGYTERVRIHSGGNLLVGTQSDNGAKLQVNGVTQASSFYSEKGTQSTANTTWTTVYTIPQTTAAQGIYYVYAHYLDGQEGMAFIQILADRTYRRSINGSNGATVSVRLDGNNIQVYQSYGSTQNIDWSILIQKLL